MADPDEVLMQDLTAMWERRDPVPDGLPDRIIAAIAAEDLDFELITLTAAEVVDVRGDGAQVFECTTDDLTLMVRISERADGSRRLDGWSEGVGEVELLSSEGARVATVSDAGRFEFDSVPPGPVRLRLRGRGKGFQTPEFEV